jgi:hypothetical protein
LNTPCYETPKNAIKKIEPNNRGKNKKWTGKKKTFFVTSPDGFFHVFELKVVPARAVPS